MKTVHLETKNQRLIKKLYQGVLINDDKFHFFYEPELVIRVGNKFLRKLVDFIKDNGYEFRVYDYPGFNKKPKLGVYCFECLPEVQRNLELFLKLYHLHSVASLTLTKRELAVYRERAIHTIFNVSGISYRGEAQELFSSAIFRETYSTVFSLFNKYIVDKKEKKM